MDNRLSLPAPGIGRAIALWLATACLGTIALVFYWALTAYSPIKFEWEILFATLLASFFAAGVLSPTLLVLPTMLRRALSAATVLRRILRLLLAINSLFWPAAIGSCWCLSEGNANPKMLSMIWFEIPYLVAALLAAYWLYHDWIFTSGRHHS